MDEALVLATTSTDAIAAFDADAQATLQQYRSIGAELREILAMIRSGRVVGQLIMNDGLAKDVNDTVIIANDFMDQVADSTQCFVLG